MHLAVVDIKNFRSLKNLRVELQPGLNVLVGRNNTGKTNFLQAIRHALGLNASRGDPLWLDRDDFFKESPNDSTERTITISLTFAGLSDEQRSHFFEIVEFDLADLQRSTATIRFEASWPKGKKQASVKRTGGPQSSEPHEVPSSLLESLPITFLPALRDAEAYLAPGYRSRLAVLLRDLAERPGSDAKDQILNIFTTANQALEERPLISNTVKSLRATTQELAGSDYSSSAIKAAPAEFEKILRTLQVEMDGSAVGGLGANGLGYNNLLYMAVVLEHLKEPEADENPLFLIEEPEAHLHPQLTLLLADYLSNKTPGSKTPQTIVTTHSPTLAAAVPPSRISVLFSNPETTDICCHGLSKARMSDKEQRELRRMMDITRATLYFAKGIILVEGISEALLIPTLAARLGHDLSKLHISVIPICGVDFETFHKVLDPAVMGIHVSVVTDSDPEVPTDVAWQEAMPKVENGQFLQSDRTKKVLSLFAGRPNIKVCCSQLTLEYDLAEAGDANGLVMGEVWESCFVGKPGTFNRNAVLQCGSRQEKALAAWRGICRASHTGSKADFAHRLTESLSARQAETWTITGFEVPAYIRDAIEHVVKGATASASGPIQDENTVNGTTGNT
jgi:putative ATP-dependent endonuclease of OLD family